MKSINIFSITVFLIFLSGFVTSCNEDFLETKPTDRVSTDAAVATTDNAMTALNGIHRALYVRYGSQGRGGLGAFYLHIDEAGEDLVFNRSNWTQSYRWLPNEDPRNAYNRANWYMFYQWIANANTIINGIDEAEGPAEERELIKGEALIYRAFCHYEMVQLWADRYKPGGNNSQLGIPIKLNTDTDPITRSTVEEVYTRINSDIDAAIGLLEGKSVTNKSHINANVAKGLKARVALTQGNWTTAAQFARQAREGYDLIDQETYRQGFRIFSENNPEFIWASHITEDQTDKFGNYGAYISRNFSSSAIRGNPRSINNLLYDKISDTDIRKTLWDPTGEHENLPDGASLLSSHKKFPYTSQKFIAVSNGDSRVDVPHMRAAEMYLIEAEALARSGQDAEAAAALLPLAQNRDNEYTMSFNTGEALIEEIMIQRRVELWGEGFRWYDLKRLDLPLDRTGSNQSEVYAGGVMQVSTDDKRWVWPIPEDEMNANELMVQNPL